MDLYRPRDDEQESPTDRLSRIVDSFSDGYSDAAALEQLDRIGWRLDLVLCSDLYLEPRSAAAEAVLDQAPEILLRFIAIDMPWLMATFADKAGILSELHELFDGEGERSFEFPDDEEFDLSLAASRLGPMDNALSLLEHLSFVLDYHGDTDTPTRAFQKLVEEDYTWLCLALARAEDLSLETLEMQIVSDYQARNR